MLKPCCVLVMHVATGSAFTPLGKLPGLTLAAGGRCAFPRVPVRRARRTGARAVRARDEIDL